MKTKTQQTMKTLKTTKRGRTELREINGKFFLYTYLSTNSTHTSNVHNPEQAFLSAQRYETRLFNQGFIIFTK